jgi:hypothetical protein
MQKSNYQIVRGAGTRFFSIILLVLSFQSIAIFSQAPASAAGSKDYKFVNGLWFDGKGFRPATFYSAGGILTKKKSRGDFETIDLAGEYVLPPFAEAHNHNVGGGIYFNLEFNRQIVRRYLSAGVFYVKIPGNPVANAAIVRRELANRPDTIDVALANAVLTSKDGHPIGMTLASFKDAGATPPSVSELEGKGFFIIENEADLNAKWETIMAGKPDFIKTILSYSESFAKRRETPSLFGYNGLDPQLMPLIVRRAHAAGLRVSVHIDSAADFSVAVRAGVDEIAHLPGLVFAPGTTEADYLISEEVAKSAARQGIIVETTAGVAALFSKGEALEKVKAVERKNIQLLRQYGVRLAVGSDNFMDTSVGEAIYLKDLNVVDNAELLRMWCETSAQLVFPGRKIGRLREGYEASLITLRGNPIEDFNQVKNIHLRFKQGIFLKD